jgi:hypothetical protein
VRALEQRSAAEGTKAFDPLPLCHPGQREAVADDTQTQAWVTTRRAGKSQGAVLKALRVATATPRVNVLYLSTSIKRAVKTLWDLLLAQNRDHELGGIPNHTHHVLELPNGSAVHVSGCETRTEADAWRGVLPRTALVFVDEGQDWKPDLLAYLYGDVVLPSLADIGGHFCMGGTPGPPRGFFYDFSRAPGVALHGWSLFGNPWVKNAREMLAEVMRVRGCDETDPSIRREFFGEFATDSVRQIFPFDDARNGYDPGARPAGKWSYVLGADFGTVDAAAVVVWGYTPHSPDRWVIETHKQHALGSSAQVELVKAVAQRYTDGLISSVGDPGGGGKGLILDLRQEHLIAMETAEKLGKASACILLRDGLRSGRVKIPRTEVEFIAELQEPEWDPERVGEVVHGHMPDRVDAALYGYRRLSGLHHFAEPAPALTEEQRQLAAVMTAQAQEDALLRGWDGGGRW